MDIDEKLINLLSGNANYEPSLRMYYNSAINLIKILKLRKHKIKEIPSLASFEEFASNTALHTKEQLSHLVNEAIDENEIRIKWFPLPSLLATNVKDIVTEALAVDAAKKFIIIVDIPINKPTKSILKDCKKLFDITVTIFTLKQMQLYIFDHNLVPKQEILSRNEAIALLEKHGIKYKDRYAKLPNIQTDDVVVQYLGAIRGQIIKVTRASDTNPNQMYVTYRIVT